jgi:hypothetical protein
MLDLFNQAVSMSEHIPSKEMVTNEERIVKNGGGYDLTGDVIMEFAYRDRRITQNYPSGRYLNQGQPRH